MRRHCLCPNARVRTSHSRAFTVRAFAPADAMSSLCGFRSTCPVGPASTFAYSVSAAASSSHTASAGTSAAAVGPQLRTQRRFVGNARPSFSEITSALAVMGVDVKACADAKALKKTYLTLVKKHHPDRGGSVEMMKNLTTAYDLLTSMTEGERRDYADRLSGGAAGRPRTTFTRANAPPRPGGYDFNDAYTRNAAHQTFRGGMGGRPLRPDPFAARAGEGMHPFVAAMGRVRRWPSSKIIFRGLMMYLVIGSMAFYVLRSYRDYLQQDGWSAAKHYERHTRMQQMQEQRSEIMERVRNRDLHTRFENERERERRIWEAQQAQKQRAAVQLRDMELASWPPLPADGSLGSVYKIPTDPPGVAYFEPPLGVIVQAQTPSASILSAEGTRVVSASDVPAAVAALPPPIK